MTFLVRECTTRSTVHFPPRHPQNTCRHTTVSLRQALWREKSLSKNKRTWLRGVCFRTDKRQPTLRRPLSRTSAATHHLTTPSASPTPQHLPGFLFRRRPFTVVAACDTTMLRQRCSNRRMRPTRDTTKVYVWSADGLKEEAGHAWYSPVPNSAHSAPGASRPPPQTSHTLRPAAIPRRLRSHPTTPFRSTLEPLWRHRDVPLSCQPAATSRRRCLRQRRRPRGGHSQKSGVRHRLSGRPLYPETNTPTPAGQRPLPRHRKASCWPLPRHNADRLAPVDASQPSSLGSSSNWKPAALGTKKSMDVIAAVPALSALSLPPQRTPLLWRRAALAAAPRRGCR